MSATIEMKRDIVVPGRKVLLLGMVFAKPPSNKHSRLEILGQEYRDRVRCEAMNEVFEVYSLDDKHDESLAVTGRHCQANFADPRRMISSMLDTWPEGISFDEIILDYFFLPAGWAAQRWTQKFFRDTLPILVEWNILKPGGIVWLPHVSHSSMMVKEFASALSTMYTIELVEDACLNPLYAATEKVTDALVAASPKAILTNATQLPYLLQITKEPFYKLTARDISKLRTPSTKSGKRAQMSPREKPEMRSVKRKIF